MSKLGKKILAGLEEVHAWVKGEGKMRMRLPGEPGRDMTIGEYREHKKETYQVEHPALLRVRSVESYRSRTGWPFWMCFTVQGGYDCIVSTEAGILRVKQSGVQIYRAEKAFPKDRKPTWGDVCLLAKIEVVVDS